MIAGGLQRGAIVGAVLALASCSASDSIGPASMEEQQSLIETARTTSPTLQPGEKLKVTVFGEDRLSGDYEIDPAGNLSLPLAGTVRAAGLDKRTAQLVKDQRTPVQANKSLVVEMNQQATSSGAEQCVGVGNNRDHEPQPKKISLSRSAPSRPRALRRWVCSWRCQARTADLRTLR